MSVNITIDFISDIACPWCAIGLKALEEALIRISDEATATIQLQPFELNPDMATEGQNMGEHLAEKYGITPTQSAINRETIRSRASEFGFVMRLADNDRVYNTFDAHRLIHWAGLQGKQLELKHILFEMYFTNNRNTADHEVLIEAASLAGLDPEQASDVLTSRQYSEEIRTEQAFWRSRGVSSVPSIIIDRKYLISGGQPADVFEQALRAIARERA